MSAGTQVTTVRIPPQLLSECMEYLECRSALACVTPWTLSDLIKVSLAEKMDHIRRSSSKQRRRLKLAEIPTGMGSSEHTIESVVQDNIDEVAP